MLEEPLTLGEKLAPVERRQMTPIPVSRSRNAFYMILNLTLMAAIWGLVSWWLVIQPDADVTTMLALLTGLVVLWWQVHLQRRVKQPRKRNILRKPHWLLANDRQGFMGSLQLDAKTAIMDGSNVYHFGHDNGLDAHPLRAIANQLREEGYRVVCFFDANIYHRLCEHGAFPADQRHSVTLLEDIFGLLPNEIYIVPSRVQADKYILESLKHLPVSFAVTNDQFRDYAKAYPTVMKGNQWRKGVAITNTEIKVLQHRFQTPIPLA
jgi:hypothetical protein